MLVSLVKVLFYSVPALVSMYIGRFMFSIWQINDLINVCLDKGCFLLKSYFGTLKKKYDLESYKL